MRAQTARAALAGAVLPLTALFLHTATISSTSAPASLAAVSHPMHHGSISNAAFVAALPGVPGNGPSNSHHSRASQSNPSKSTTTTSPVANSVLNITATLADADSAVLNEVKAYAQQAAAYNAAQQQAQRQRDLQAAESQRHSSQSSSDGSGSSSVSYLAPPPSVAAVLACIRHYESNDNYSDSSNPNYRGAYQFSWSSWQLVGGTGDPAQAPPAEQDMRAAMLMQQYGWGQWSTAPLCGV